MTKGGLKPEVALVMGSESDWPLVEEAVSTLKRFGVGCEVRVLSAHRSPSRATAFARAASGRGLRVLMAAAGSAAHLAGTLAAHTTLPVIGIPVKGGALDGMDALLSTVQMPAGVPVATVALGRAGAVNAALLAVQILALSRPELAARLRTYRNELQRKVAAGDRRLRNAQRA